MGITNSRLDTSLSSSVLDYALTLPEGMHTVRFPGDSYTGADTPNSYYKYSSATIIVRSKGTIVTVLLYGISSKAPLAANSYDGGKWNGWDQYVTKDDLNTCAQKEFKPSSGNWASGIQNSYFKMEKHSGDSFSPFLKMSTDDGAWVIGIHSISNQLVFRYYKNETGDGVTVYKFTPNATPKEV